MELIFNRVHQHTMNNSTFWTQGPSSVVHQITVSNVQLMSFDELLYYKLHHSTIPINSRSCLRLQDSVPPTHGNYVNSKRDILYSSLISFQIPKCYVILTFHLCYQTILGRA